MRRLVRVRRKHQRSMRLSMLFLVFSLAIYLLSYAVRLSMPGPVSEGAPESAPVSVGAPAAEQVTRDIRFDALTCYLVELGNCDSAEAARIEAGRYVGRGAAGYVLQDGQSFAVVGACYESLEEAQKVAARLEEQEKLPCRVRTLTGPPAALRVTATQAQIDALEGAERSVRGLTGQLGDISYGLDGGTLSVDAAKEQLSRMRAEAELRVQALERAAGSEKNSVIDEMMMLASELRQLLQDRIASSETNRLSFSAQIKYNKITMRVRHAAFLSALSA